MAEDSPVSDTYADGRASLPRWAGALIGLAIGGAIGTLIPVPDDRAAERLSLMLVGALAGTPLGAVRPPRFKLAKLPEGTAAAPGEPVPLGGLAGAVVAETNRRIGTAFGLGLLASVTVTVAVLGTYFALGERMSALALVGHFFVLYLIAVASIAVLPQFLVDEPTRRSLVVLHWSGAREWRRLSRSPLAVARFPTTPEARKRWLEKNFDRDSPRAIDVEVLLLSGDVDAAREAAARLPASTPLERFAKSEREAFVHYQATGEVDTRAMEEAVANIPPGLDRIEANASVAQFEARTLLPDGDWRAPLLAVRDTIPGSDTRILLRDFGWSAVTVTLFRLWPVLVLFAGLVVAAVFLF